MGAAVSPAPEEAAALIGEVLCAYAEQKESDGVLWRQGTAALAALDGLVAALRDARRDGEEAARAAVRRTLERDEARRERDQARDALAQFANPQHWAIRRGTFAHPDCVWIGTHTQSPVDLARAALGGAAEETR